MLRRFAPFIAIVTLASCDAAPNVAQAQTSRPAASANAPSAGHPVVLELYQSQGCSSCPPANANVNALAGRPEVLALSFAVTYWDRLGWRDRFADPAYTARQWDYARANARGSVWTPQLVINGRAATVTGRDAGDIAAQIRAAGRPRGGPAIAVHERTVSLSSGATRRRAATVWLVHYDPRELAVPVTAGENDGRTLPHRNIVRRLVQLGVWSGAARTFEAANPADRAWRSAVLVQQGTGGPIIAARRL
jgi:hypothetical protein